MNDFEPVETLNTTSARGVWLLRTASGAAHLLAAIPDVGALSVRISRKRLTVEGWYGGWARTPGAQRQPIRVGERAHLQTLGNDEWWDTTVVIEVLRHTGPAPTTRDAIVALASVVQTALAAEPVTVLVPAGSETEWAYCPVGWAELMRNAVHELDAQLPGRWALRNAKEKFGGLDVHLDLSPACTPQQMAAAARISQEIRGASQHVCDTCGAPGEARVVESYVVTVCDSHTDPGNRPGKVAFEVRDD